MMALVLIAAAFLALTIQSTNGETPHDSDQSYDCVKFCSYDDALNATNIKSRFYSVFLAELPNPRELNQTCAEYSRFSGCYKYCPDGPIKSQVTDMLEPLEKGCLDENSRRRTMESNMTCAYVHSPDACHSSLSAQQFVEIEAATYGCYERACGDAAPDRMTFSELCDYGDCYIKYIQNVTKAQRICKPVDASFWQDLMMGLFQPGVTRRVQTCGLPKEVMPKMCKDFIVVNGGSHLKVPMSNVVAVVIVMMKLSIGCLMR